MSTGIPVNAQEERPHFTPGERKAPKKKDVGPRALAVLQMSANGKVSLVPVAILINGKFWDASAYKANPVPMALDSGTVYEAERTGSSVGLFTVASALHSNSPNAPIPWIGTGQYLAQGKEAPNKPMKAEITPVGVGSSDDPPRLTKPGLGSNDKPSTDKPASDKASNDKVSNDKSGANGAPASTSTPPTPSSGDEPPRLSKPAASGGSGSTQSNSGSTTQSQSGSSSPTSSPDAKTPDSKTSDGKTSGSKPSDTAADKPAEPKAPESDSGAGAGNRPRLRRGKPTTSFADEDIPGYSKPGVKPVASTKTAAQEIIDLVPAISDAGSNELHAFSFVWLKDEEDERRKQIEGIARQEVLSYLDARAKAKTTTLPTKTGARSATHPAPKRPDPILENVKMVAYDLWGNNTPVIVFSADAHLPTPPAGGPHSDVEAETQYSVMLVMRPDIYDTLRKLYVGVTDKYHLDITPRLQLIDAVDADGDGRGELLFQKVSDAGTGWIVYRANADKLWKLFDSLSPE